MGFLLISKVLKKQKNFLPNLSEIELIRVNFFLLIVKFFFLLVYLFLSKNIPELQQSNRYAHYVNKLLSNYFL